MVNILFVCYGNICRSPAAEGIMRELIIRENLKDEIFCDSAGTSNCNAGSAPSQKMREIASSHGYKLLSMSRGFNGQNDFEVFDYIITMDNRNYEDILYKDRYHKHYKKVVKLSQFFDKEDYDEVPDPYVSDDPGYKEVFLLIERACINLLKFIKEKHFE